MTNANTYYPSKLLLFGEYLVVTGGAGLAVPYPAYKGHWEAVVTEGEDCLASRQSLEKILTHFAQLPLPFGLDMARWQAAHEAGQWFCSNIPFGYGLGSSGALSAAIYDKYALQKTEDLTTLKEHLALIEQFFHGKSSGIDPLVSYLKCPLHLISGEKIEKITLPSPTANKGNMVLFLLDTGITRQAAPLVEYFLHRVRDARFLANGIQPLQQASNQAIAAFLQNDAAAVWEQFANISDLQYRFFSYMIPDALRDTWETGLRSGVGGYRLKLCGAGGGGFLLGLSHDWQKTQKQLEKYRLFSFHYFQ